jgi:ribonuclease D
MNLITKTTDLDAFCKRAQTSSYITVDTEFIREKTYWSELCLIQVGLEREAVAIDPLAQDIDLSSFFDLLQNQEIIKVLHSGRQDVEIFYHLTGKIPTPLFDTQIAAMVCGFGESVGYDVLVQKYTQISIDKSSRYTHWGQRPLTDKQLEYALGDVTHLRTVYEKLKEKVTKEDRFHWVEEELAILKDPATYDIDPYAIWKKLRVRSPKPRMLAILRELAAWREITAQERNIPRVRVMRDELMLELAASAPKSQEDLGRMRGRSRFFFNAEDERTILELIEKAQKLPLEDCPDVKKGQDSPAGFSSLVEMLRLLLKICSDKHHVAPKLLATTSDLEDIARSSAPTTPALEGWRYEIFGKSALALKEGKVALGLKNKKIALIEVK